ncbi:uncharacterized protein LOC123534648 [Mercenaria mercenaria]|uniref:uncharacterized protein LOC123534648 n=1 Tax=Mercenaria mercenaria TaxID=6596 RepID=UPI00234EAA8E|nr:uncharacterized protein LOC123534648 [Mercenaria mercenaria]
MESKFGSLTIPQLKAELKKRGARLSGRKNELVERLVSYERNQNFGNVETLEPEYNMTLPDPTKYADVNSDSKFPKTELDSVHKYLAQHEKTLDNRIQRLYNEQFLRYFRMSPGQDVVYIKSSCHAEMKKGVCYTVDIELNSGGSVIEAQCECAAGMGPHAHCKHVCTVLYGAVMFSQKKTVKTEETCTQKLQSFHKCKKYLGSPLKADTLDMPGAAELTNIDFDPRPEQFRNSVSYQDHFRNACLNFPGISKMPIFQTFEPANTKAVALDHDYLKLSPEENFLQKIFVTKISDETVIDIEKKTMGQSVNKLWKEERTKRLPSSMFGKICKSTDRTDKDKLARSLVDTREIKAAALEHGRKHETIAITRFMEDTGNTVHSCGLVVSKQFPFLASSPDGIINAKHIVEAKCPYSARDKDITPVTVPYLSCYDRGQYSLNMNHNYYYQIQGQLLCTGAKKCSLIICSADNLKIRDIKYFDIERNDTFISEMVGQLKTFFESHFKMVLLEKHFYKPYID